MPPLRRLTCLLLLGGISLQAGCDGKAFFRLDKEPVGPSPRASAVPQDHQGTPPAESFEPPPTMQYYVHYDVLRVEVPRGTVSRSEADLLWNHVDESVLPFAVTRRLRLNGFRVGLADRGAWPAIKAILDSGGAVQVAQAGLAQADLLPLAIEIDSRSRDRTIFHYGPDDTLQGSTYADSLNLLRIEHYLNPRQLSQFTLRLVPEVRRAHPQTTLAATEAGLREIPVYDGKVFTDLAVEMDLPEGSIIVVGPSDRAGRQALIGTAFLCDQRNGVEFERIFFITPRLVARQKPAAGSSPQGRSIGGR